MPQRMHASERESAKNGVVTDNGGEEGRDWCRRRELH
jgi:hypothetical protein